MAFHVACPITCRKICFCTLGFRRGLQSEKGKNDFLKEVARVEQFLKDPWLTKTREENATIQVRVPKVVVTPAPQIYPPQVTAVTVGGGDEEAVAAASAQVKRVALQKQAAAESVEAEDYARRFESGDLVPSVEDTIGDTQGPKVMCRLCFHGENEGSEKARKMLSCNCCGKKYHRSCVKSWSQNRDLFHWSSWTCPSCRTCEVCRRTGDPNKLMFCKRCDAAHHCYCQQPPHKNVGHGPYLCPKHTKCHSCASSVPGNGLSVRWFLGYTCCDACGRLFVKNNYCPVCLKVYRDSESTPMVCCDICQKWVHCPCDAISDSKYMQFQVDGNLQYVCPTCRGECSQIRSLEKAVQELWKRRDEADKDLIASLREAAGLPTQDEIYNIRPFSDDEEGGPFSVKNESGRSFKFSLKGAGDKSPQKSKEYGKKSSNKKHGKKKWNETSLISGNEDMQFSGAPLRFSPVNEAAVSKERYVEEVNAISGSKPSRTIKIKSTKPYGFTDKDDNGTQTSVSKASQVPKLVIHLGGRNKNATTAPRSESSSFGKGQDLASSNGQELDRGVNVKGSMLRESGHLIKLKNAKLEASKMSSKFSGGEFADGHESISSKSRHSLLGKRGIGDIESVESGSKSKSIKHTPIMFGKDGPTVSADPIDDNNSTNHGRKPFLKFKIPKSSNNGNQSAPGNLNTENQSPMVIGGKDEITYTRGQRSKRRRPGQADEDTSLRHDDIALKDFMDANWILQKLGKDAAGKRVEIHQAANDTWLRGTVIEVFEGTSIVSIGLDGGNATNFELGKQGIRFVSQKQKR